MKELTLKEQLNELQNELKDFDERTRQDIGNIVATVNAEPKWDDRSKQMYFAGITFTLKMWKKD